MRPTQWGIRRFDIVATWRGNTVPLFQSDLLITDSTSNYERVKREVSINNVPSLLHASNVFSIFRLDCDETHDLRGRVWLQLTDGTYFVRPAVRENLDCCISLLREKLNVQGQPQQNLLNAHIAAPASSPRE